MPRNEDIRQVIEGVLKVWETSDQWCQGHDATNRNKKVIQGRFDLKTGKPFSKPIIKDEPVDPRSPFATSWCAQGAVIRSMCLLALRNFDKSPDIDLLQHTLRYVSNFIPEDWVDEMKEANPHVDPSGFQNIVRYNDQESTTFEDVRLCFKKALHSFED